MHIQTVLYQLGYPGGQVKIYLAALKMGSASVSEITEAVNMPRSTVTELLLEMQKSGIMNYYERRGKKIWGAENPDKLMIILKEREAGLQTILPLLHAMRHSSGEGKPNIRNYIGSEEVKTIFDDIIATKQHIKALVSWEDFRESFGNDFVDDFVERRYKHFLRIHVIIPKTESAIKLKEKDSEQLRVTRLLPEHIDLRRVSNFIYGGKVALVSMNRKQPVGTVMEDPDIFHAMSIYFEALWQQSTA